MVSAVKPQGDQQATVFVRTDYQTTAAVARPLSPDPGAESRAGGAAILGYAFIPSYEAASVRIVASASASAEATNRLVLAAYLGQSGRPAALASMPMSPGERSHVCFALDVPANRPSVSVELRIGPAEAGEIVLNGVGPEPRFNRPQPVLSMREIGALARDGLRPGYFDFPDDDGGIGFASAQLLYEGEVVEAQRGPQHQRLDPESYLGRDDVLVLLTAGQSLASNEGDTLYVPQRDVAVFDYFDSQVYRAADPLPGASNHKGSLWSRLGDRLLAEGPWRAVLIVAVGYGGSYLTEWTPGARLYRRLIFALHRLRRAGVRPHAILWQQGEAEAGLANLPPEHYVHHFGELVTTLGELGHGAPIYLARGTTAGSAPPPNRIAVRAALAALGALGPGLRAGPDTDEIGLADRYDQVHLSASGMEKAAALWADILARDFSGKG